ncbi:hypothetical protein E4U42_002244 [Claviceps africana]|uniref:Inactive metallocarboxypeptidase ECM14 n=1 Tax=Claviceps africana TaxID=83212 RepID=A0A8K0NJW9_9HYPO|nr:hypothetical protein E4U42_002244 [Claviceps africana]
MKSEIGRVAASTLLLLLICIAVVAKPIVSDSNAADVSFFPLLTRIRSRAIKFFIGRRPADSAEHDRIMNSLRAKYANEIVLRFNITTSEDGNTLAAAANRLSLDVWAFSNNFVDIRLHRDEVATLLSHLPSPMRSVQTLIPDLAMAIYSSLPFYNHAYDDKSISQLAERLGSVSPPTPAVDHFFFHDYQPLPVIVRWMRLLEAMFPSFVEYMSVGISFEERDISALRLRVPQSVDSTSPRKTIVFTGGIHAREWISTSTVNYLAWSFIMSFGNEPTMTKFLHEYDIVFVPTINPDGMEYSWQVDRLWRKSRQQTNLRYCSGLDLDHTFDYGWDRTPPQANPCSENYRGERPFQAVETMQLARWARNESLNNIQFVGFIDLHSYSQQILFPYSFSCETPPPNLENLEEVATGIAKAIRVANGELYSVTSACKGAVPMRIGPGHNQSAPRMEPGGGSAIDWFYHEMGAHFSYQIKLRDTGSYGFLLPKEQIVPTGQEVFASMRYLGDFLLGNNGIEKLSKSKGEIYRAGSVTSQEDTTCSDYELKRRVPRG